MNIRIENENDESGVYAVNASAFETPAEAKLVDVLRLQANPVISLVAEHEGKIVGHIMFSAMTFQQHPELRIMGLGPMAVSPDFQRQDIGSQLVRAGLKLCTQSGTEAVFVLGHPAFYPRFGFLPAAGFAIKSEYDVPHEVFMGMELQSSVLNGKTGMVKYHDAFSNV
jgi:putative acetyltransferase